LKGEVEPPAQELLRFIRNGIVRRDRKKKRVQLQMGGGFSRDKTDYLSRLLLNEKDVELLAFFKKECTWLKGRDATKGAWDTKTD